MSLSPTEPLLAVAGGVSFLLSLIGTFAMRRIALRVGFVDNPGGHKSHREPRPYGGGVAIFLAAALPVAAALAVAVVLPDEWISSHWGETARVYLGGLRLKLQPAVAVLLGAIVIHILGLRDDLKPLGPYPKLIALILVATGVVLLGDIRIALFAGPIGSAAITVAWIIVLTNAFNFLDNMDGLSAGVAGICMAFFVVCGLLAGQFLVPALACLFLGAIGGFLVFNFPPAKIFMGDAGSLLCGYLIAIVSILTTYFHQSNRDDPGYSLLMPVVVLAVPLYDFISVIGIRLLEGRNPMKGDQRHFSHRLVEHGLSRRFAVFTIYLATAATGLAATLLPGADLRETITVGVLVLMVLLIVAILESKPRREA